jgi:hypothetical protein
MKHARAESAGFTLLEMTIGIGVLGLVMWMAGSVTRSSRTAYGTSSLQQAAETKARRAVDKLVAELAAAGEATLIVPGVPGPEDGIEFLKATGVVAGAVAWSAPVRIVSELDPGEAHDGLDDDGDGAIDERRLVIVRDAGLPAERRIVVCKGVASLLEGESEDGDDDNGNGLVDEAGFSITLAAKVLTIRLSVEEHGGDGGVAIATVETAVRLRMED